MTLSEKLREARARVQRNWDEIALIMVKGDFSAENIAFINGMKQENEALEMVINLIETDDYTDTNTVIAPSEDISGLLNKAYKEAFFFKLDNFSGGK